VVPFCGYYSALIWLRGFGSVYGYRFGGFLIGVEFCQSSTRSTPNCVNVIHVTAIGFAVGGWDCAELIVEFVLAGIRRLWPTGRETRSFVSYFIFFAPALAMCGVNGTR